MVTRLASRAAGNKLATIICILVVPMLVVGTAYIRSMAKDIAVLDKEILGFELTREAYRSVLHGDQILDEKVINRIRQLETSLKVSSDATFEKHLDEHKIFFPEINSSNGLRKANQPIIGHGHEKGDSVLGYFRDISSKSGLILDGDEASYHLINSLIVHLPEIVSNSRDLQNAVESKVGILARSATYFGEVGKLAAANARFKDSLVRAMATPGQADIYQAFKASANNLNLIVDDLTRSAKIVATLPGHESIDNSIVQIEKEVANLHGFGFDFLKTKLESRRASLRTELLLMACLGLASSFLAIGLAAKMFSSTLRKLDEVEAARTMSDRMRDEAQNISGELANLNGELSKNLKQLGDAQDELVKKGRMEQLGQLTATVAHEIRNPLGSVRTSTFLIKRKVAGKELGIDVQLERIEKGVTRCDDIITQLLDFSRTKSVAGQAARLDDWLEATVTEEMEQLPQSVTLECILGLGDQEVPFDGPRLRRAVVNLLRNASEAMVGDGKDASKATTQNAKITITTRKVNGAAAIIVSDNGPGMSPETLSKIREPLFTTKSFGTGLGVPAVEQIVVQHGGELSIESEVNKGATFTITLPLDNKARQAA